MPQPTTYEIVLRGRASARVLRPLVDDFTLEYPRDGVTRLVGAVSDAAHLHGILSHLTSVNVELISVRALDLHALDLHPIDPKGSARS
ncbi:MAG: hypothetical protein ABI658_02495 [Acidimicrobiales bacterium]